MATKKTKALADKKNGTHDGRTISCGDDAQVIEAFKLGSRDDIGVVSVSEYKGRRALDVRRYYLDDQSEEFKPTSKGIRIPADQAEAFLDLLSDNRNAILEALR